MYAVIPERDSIKGTVAAVVLALQTRPALAPISPHHLTRTRTRPTATISLQLTLIWLTAGVASSIYDQSADPLRTLNQGSRHTITA